MCDHPLTPPVGVDRPEVLQNLLPVLLSEPRLAVDTESNSLHAYREQVCLIQFSTPQTDYLIDPLALSDLSPLAPLFADPNIEKIFHAAEYDLICLKRDFGFQVTNIFDTMQSARILGYPQVGLDGLLTIKYGIHLEKRYQKADWGARPLSPEMLNYARLDTHYLLRLRDDLQAELEAANLSQLAREEFIRLSKLDGNGKTESPTWERIGRGAKLTDRQLAVLKALCDWRDQVAERLDRPAFKVLDEKRLIALSQALPRQPEDLAPLLSQYQQQRFGPEILRAVKTGLSAPPPSRQRSRRPNDAVLARLKALSQWRKQQAQALGLESDLILPKAWMQTIAERAPHTLDELANLMPESPWRLEKFGPAILKIIENTR
jgi:ribonuclease D